MPDLKDKIGPCPCCRGEMEYTDEVEYQCRPYWECKDCCYAFEERGDGSYEVHEQLSHMAAQLAAYEVAKEATGGMDIFCNSCGTLVAKITGDNPDYDGTCLKCGASIHIRSYEVQSWRLVQLEHFAELAKPIVEDTEEIRRVEYYGSFRSGEEPRDSYKWDRHVECTRCLAAWPITDPDPRGKAESDKPIDFDEDYSVDVEPFDFDEALKTRAARMNLKQPLSHCHNAPAEQHSTGRKLWAGGIEHKTVCSKCKQPFLTAEEKANGKI